MVGSPALLVLLPATLEVLGASEGLEEVEGRGQADEEAHEDDARDERVHRTPEHVDQELRQHHQRYKGEEQ